MEAFISCAGTNCARVTNCGQTCTLASSGFVGTSAIRAHTTLRRARRVPQLACSAVEGPTKLNEITRRFQMVPDPKLRYQQLLFMAKELPPMKDEYKTPENKVPGCLSTVYVHVELDDDKRVQLSGDSDAQLTKGLIALLIKGLNGSTVEQVMNVDPGFIATSGLSVSLTPGRNNGFLNMLKTIKKKAMTLVESGAATESSSRNGSGMVAVEESAGRELPKTDPSRPIYSAIITKLSVLKPTVLQVQDDSAQHAGHAEAKGLNGESHFTVRIVSAAFDGLTLVKRHQIVYMLLAEEMKSGIHALSIQAQTPTEAN